MPGIGTAIFAALTGDSFMAQIVGDKVYPADQVDDAILPPYAEYAVTREDEDRALEGTLLGYDAEVVVTFVTPTYPLAQSALLNGRRILNAMRGVVGGHTILAAQVTDGSDTPSGPVLRDDQQSFQADLTAGVYYFGG
jgi:hypothetical protein